MREHSPTGLRAAAMSKFEVDSSRKNAILTLSRVENFHQRGEEVPEISWKD